MGLALLRPTGSSLGFQSDFEEGEVEVEITWQSPAWDRTKSLATRVPKLGYLRFGRLVSQVSVVVDYLDVEIGDGGETTFLAPVIFDVKSLLLNSSKVVVESREGERPKSVASGVPSLRAEYLHGRRSEAQQTSECFGLAVRPFLGQSSQTDLRVDFRMGSSRRSSGLGGSCFLSSPIGTAHSENIASLLMVNGERRGAV